MGGFSTIGRLSRKVALTMACPILAIGKYRDTYVSRVVFIFTPVKSIRAFIFFFLAASFMQEERDITQ